MSNSKSDYVIQRVHFIRSVDRDGRLYAPLRDSQDCLVCGGQLDYIPSRDIPSGGYYHCQRCDRVFVCDFSTMVGLKKCQFY